MRKAVSLFTGAGGLDIGLEAAGFETAVAVEIDKWACRTIRANRDWPLIEDDIHNVSSQNLKKMGQFNRDFPDLLIGGPPCQPFSKSSYWVTGDSKRLDDPRAGTLSAFLRVLRDLQPKVFLLENVEGLTFNGKDEGLQLIKNMIPKINKEMGSRYRVWWKILNAADYGVPQIRERVYLIGSKDGKCFKFPEPTHANPELFRNDLFPKAPWKTAWDAIGDLVDSTEMEDHLLTVGGKWGDLLPSIPEGKNYLFHTEREQGLPLFGWRAHYWGFLLKLAKDRPSWTLQSQPGTAIGPFHWDNRKLTPRELCRIQSLPDNYHITGSRTEVQRQVGNAVASLMGEILGREIREQLFGDTLPNSDLLLNLKRRYPIPEPNLHHRVPDKYLHLAGHYAAHPGTGRGREACRRKQELLTKLLDVDGSNIPARKPITLLQHYWNF